MLAGSLAVVPWDPTPEGWQAGERVDSGPTGKPAKGRVGWSGRE